MKFWAKCLTVSVFFSLCWMCKSFAAFDLTSPANDANIVRFSSWVASGGGTYKGGTVFVKAWKNAAAFNVDVGEDDQDCAGQGEVQSTGQWGATLVYASGADTDGYVKATQDGTSDNATSINWK